MTGVAAETRAPAAFDDGADARRSLGWLIPLGAALLLGVFIPLAYAALSGNLGIPHNDTWAFGRSAQDFVHTGQVRMYNWNMMGLAGLVVVAWPVGASLTAQSVFVAGIAVAGLVACFDVLAGVFGAGEPGGRDGRRKAALGTLVVALWPGFALLSTSFMTDVPAFAAIAATLAFGRRALDRLSLPWLVAACVVGLWGATVREQVLAAPAAVLAVALFRARYRADRVATFRVPHLLGIGAVLVAAIGAFELWRRGVPGGGAPDFTVRKVTPALVSVELIQGLLIVALVVSPVVFAAVRPRGWSRAGWVTGGVTLVSGLLASWHRGAFLGNYVTHDGAYSAASSSGRPILLGSGWWAALAWLACISAALLAGTVVERVRRDGWTLGLGFRAEILLFAGATVLGTLLEVGQGRDIYDRYLIPMAIPALVLLLSGPAVEAAPAVVRELPSRASRVWGAVRAAALGRIAAVIVAVAMVAGTAGTLLVNAFTFDTAVWHTASRIVASGKADAQHVDAGLVWDGFHSPGAMYDHPDRAISRDFFGGLRYLPNHSPCYVVSPSPHAPGGWSLVSVQHYKTYGFVGDAALYVFRVGGSQKCS